MTDPKYSLFGIILLIILSIFIKNLCFHGSSTHSTPSYGAKPYQLTACFMGQSALPARVPVSHLIRRYLRNSSINVSEDYKPLLQPNPILEKIFVMADCGVAIFDASKAGYLYISHSLEQLLGYPASAYLEGGLNFAFSIVHPEDSPGMVLILEKELDLLHSMTIEDRLEHRSSYDYRFRRTDGSYIRVWQRNLILDLDEAGNMLYMLIMVNDISHLKKDDTQILNLNAERNGLFGYTYHTQEKTLTENHFLSRRELEVLDLLSKNYSNQQIADVLNVSIHTVQTHRRNMLERSNIRDTSCLISFALTAGLI